PHRGDRRRRTRGLRGGRSRVAGARGQDHARRGRRHVAHHPPATVGRMRLPTLRSVPAPPPAPEPGPPSLPGPTPPWRRLLRAPTLRDVREALRRNPGLKLVSLLLAFFLWFSINVSERNAERIVDLQVTVRQVPADLIVPSAPADPVKVTLKGPRTIIDGVDERKTRLALDLSGAGPGDVRVELSADMIRPEVPRRMKVAQIDPARL